MTLQQILAFKEKAKLLPISHHVQSQVCRPNPASCICNRPLQDILCKACGYIVVGRVRKVCPVHSSEIHLMDMACCPKCTTSSLFEIKGIESPAKQPCQNINEELTGHQQKEESVNIQTQQIGDGDSGLSLQTHIESLNKHLVSLGSKVRVDAPISPVINRAHQNAVEQISMPEINVTPERTVTYNQNWAHQHPVEQITMPERNVTSERTVTYNPNWAHQNSVEQITTPERTVSYNQNQCIGTQQEGQNSVSSSLRRPFLEESKPDFTIHVSNTANSTEQDLSPVQHAERRVSFGSGSLKDCRNDLKIYRMSKDRPASPVTSTLTAQSQGGTPSKPRMIDSEVQTESTIQGVDKPKWEPPQFGNAVTSANLSYLSCNPVHKFGSVSIGNFSNDSPQNNSYNLASSGTQMQEAPQGQEGPRGQAPRNPFSPTRTGATHGGIQAAPQSPPNPFLLIQKSYQDLPRELQMTENDQKLLNTQSLGFNAPEQPIRAGGNSDGSGAELDRYGYNPRKAVTVNAVEEHNLLKKVLHQRRYPGNSMATELAEVSAHDMRL